jgi:hypothetical protein
VKGHLLVVGQQYGVMRTTDPSQVPLHRTLYRWCDALGIKNYSFVNVQQTEGEWCPLQQDYDFLQDCLDLHEGPILVLGQKAWSAMKDIYGWNRRGAIRGPHPSGRNRQFNEKRFEEVLIEYLYREIHGKYV